MYFCPNVEDTQNRNPWRRFGRFCSIPIVNHKKKKKSKKEGGRRLGGEGVVCQLLEQGVPTGVGAKVTAYTPGIIHNPKIPQSGVHHL